MGNSFTGINVQNWKHKLKANPDYVKKKTENTSKDFYNSRDENTQT